MRTINGETLKDILISGSNNLFNHYPEVDALNVFPVPDGDTGMNMNLTCTSGANEIQKMDTTNIYEVATAFEAALETGEWKEIAQTISTCDELLDETIDGNADRVAQLIELAHETYTSVLNYNDENSLSCVLTMAYFTAPAYYNVVREMPAGKGFADFVFIPRANAGTRPAMVVELKYNKDADTAIKQIKEKRYQGALAGYEGKILLVGVNYDVENKHHTCVIEEM